MKYRGRLERAIWSNRRTRLVDPEAGPVPSNFISRKGLWGGITTETQPDAIGITDKVGGEGPFEVWCLQVLHNPGTGIITGYEDHWGMILQAVSVETFKRIGIFRLESRCEPLDEMEQRRHAWFKSSEPRLITLL